MQVLVLHVAVEVLTAVTMRSTTFWIIKQYGSETTRRFGGIDRIHLHGQPHFATCFLWFLACLILNPEYEGAKFLRNAGLSPNYTALKPGRLHSFRYCTLKYTTIASFTIFSIHNS
jgi:hypothetical protein